MQHDSTLPAPLLAPARPAAPAPGTLPPPDAAARQDAMVPRPPSPARPLWNLLGVGVAVLAAVLLLLPGVSPWWGVVLAVGGVVALAARWVMDLFRFDYDFSMVRLTEEELAQDLDW